MHTFMRTECACCLAFGSGVASERWTLLDRNGVKGLHEAVGGRGRVRLQVDLFHLVLERLEVGVLRQLDDVEDLLPLVVRAYEDVLLIEHHAHLGRIDVARQVQVHRYGAIVAIGFGEYLRLARHARGRLCRRRFGCHGGATRSRIRPRPRRR